MKDQGELLEALARTAEKIAETMQSFAGPRWPNATKYKALAWA
jgi:hypothetical protein